MKNNFLTKVSNGFKESYTELVHKVTWPTRTELANSSVVVLIASIIIALVVWLMDFSFENIMTFVYGLFY
ncbi:MAG: preprotein translocase subunit SecE [Porphyromonadaceae bacterium]|nr:preprotein translocase subunit SecE [Porphyromonadaceae bacterium]